MADLVDSLQQDHANITRLLRVLEQQVALIRRAERPDYDVLLGLMTWFFDYPDACHHPKEDLLARRLAEAGVAPSSMAEGLAEQHRALGEQLRRFSDALHAVLEERELSREAFADLADEFISSQRKHLEQEEQHFFPLARSALSEEGLELPDFGSLDRDDPLFGAAQEQERFEALRKAILEWTQEDEEA
jgi:hemerythrin-like domain-containing protein